MASAVAAPAIAPAIAIAAVNSPDGQREAESVRSIKESFHIETLLNYLPVIVLVIIILISIVTSDLLKDNAIIFATLVIVFAWVTFIHYLSPSKYDDLKNENPAPTFLPKLVSFPNVEKYIYAIVAGIFALGIGLGFGSIPASRSAGNYDPSAGMITVGSIMLIVSFFYFLFVAFNNIPGLKNIPTIGHIINYCVSKFDSVPLPLIILLIIFGIPLVVRGSEIKDNLNSGKLTEDKYNMDEYQKTIANTSAEWMLGLGVFFQIAVFMAVGYWLWGYTTNTSAGSSSLMIIFSAIAIAIFMPGGLFLSKSLGLTGSGFGTDADKKLIDKEPFEYKALMVHAVIYLIVGVIFLIILFGQTQQFTVVKYGGLLGLTIALCIMIVVAASVKQAANNKEMEMNTLEKDGDSVYYKQLRDEAVKELKQKNSNATQAEIDNAVTTRLDELRNKSQDSTAGIMWTFSILSLLIVGFILKCYNDRITLFSHGKLNADIKEKIKDDAMLSVDWDKLLADPGNSITSLTIHFAKWASFVPFLSVILIILWVGILFTNVTTSPTTANWIGKTFSGDMFPRVKELIDAFFITIIAGLSLCAILLLPVVKEMNVGGLESILKFAESIQVWQFDKNEDDAIKGRWSGLLFFLVVFGAGLSWWWHYLARLKPDEEAKTGVSLPIVPDNWGWAIAFVVLLAICAIPAGYNMWAGVNDNFAKENALKRILRQILTTIYLVPLLIIALFRLGLYGIASLTGIPEFVNKYDETKGLFKFWEWDAEKTDLRMFQTGEQPTPASVTSMPAAAAAAAAAPSASPPPATEPPTGINETKISAIGKLIKVILLTISIVILILAVIYYVYKIDAEFINKSGGADATASGGFAAQMNSTTAHTIYVIMAIVALAGLVAYIRDKFTKANSKTPENYLFNDLKTEDEAKPLRQLAFGATHILYVILMVIVWIYDREISDDKNQNRLSISGMTILGLAILFFHYGLEFIDTMNPAASAPASVSDLFTNIRFIINTIFLIVLCALAYYKQAGVMVVLILAMFIFHLTKSVIGIKLLHLVWLGIIYIPCIFLDFIQSSQTTVGDTTRPIWIIVGIEILLIAILYGGPYLLNYIGASASQIVAAPVSLNEKYDTNLNTQSPQIFIFHNTGIDRSPEDKAANCPVEEKKRYNYSISGWFLLNNNVTSTTKDLEIFNFGDVPRMTYNPSTAELKLYCNTLDMNGNPKITSSTVPIYSSKANYNSIISGKTADQQRRVKMLFDDDAELDTPVPLQRWNYFVVNYNGKTMDFFLNTKLIVGTDFIMPDIQLKPITVGDEKGLNGSICNFAFHTTPLTKEQMRWTYKMLKSQNPPMIGMTTIEDDVKMAGSTKVYSK